ncbi:hypothetical protein [Vibrio vulnificus]|uniref:hypothetical protein n=1 Tax=Vibrio vulnificus TaxID=672 RepID=UPI0010290051|nr:hypothetical protein [Vibrio vulnificus]RZP70928.1 hypothetical protein D8T53_03780 [Vibrio vulnificus]HAS6198952.1 hypothetical protein [Vibrio vulnificus]HAS8303875.1 hypothetical protein [Vibrio vulnificus]
MKKKLAIFDLDGTLYFGNSHVRIVDSYFNINFDWFLFKILGKISLKIYMGLLYFLYNRIPKSFKRDYTLDFRPDCLALLKELSENNYNIIIVSNAPIELVRAAARKLSLDFYRTEINMKHTVLSRLDYEYLFVCTDNVSDISLLEHADESIVYCREKNRNLFSTINNITFRNF